MNTPHLEAVLQGAWLPESWADVSVVVAVSGGIDSVALLRALAAIRHPGAGQLMVAHFNHQLRGSDSDADELFVGRLAEKLGLCFRAGRPAPGEIADSDGIEESARNSRYRFLTNAAEEFGARYLVFAHTADDQIETILHRIVRGTGLAGLAGIPRCRRLSTAVTLIRPLLDVRRTELADYLASLGQPYREDRSNLDRRFTRNRIRHELLPHLAEAYNPVVGEALLRLGQLAGEAQNVVDGLVRELVAEGAVADSGSGLTVYRHHVKEQPDYLVRELLIHLWQSKGWPMQSMGYEEWSGLLSMLRDDPESSSKRTFPGQVLAECRIDGLSLRRDVGP